MVFPLVRRWGVPIFGTLKSLRSKGTGLSRSDGPAPGSFRLEDKNPRRGMGPRSGKQLLGFTFAVAIMLRLF